jgi:hypothetical protein
LTTTETNNIFPHEPTNNPNPQRLLPLMMPKEDALLANNTTATKEDQYSGAVGTTSRLVPKVPGSIPGIITYL